MFSQILANKDLFVHLLSKEERKVLVYAFAYLAHLDRTLHQSELDLITMIAHNLYLDPQLVIANVETVALEDILKPIQTERAKRIILHELISLAYADDHYSEEECAGIQEIAAILGVTPTVLTQIEDWVKRGRIWKNEGIQLILEAK